MIPENRARHAYDGEARLPGASRDAALHDQLFLYAEDIQVLLDSNNELTRRHRALRESGESAMQGQAALEGLIQATKDIYLLTDGAGIILQSNAAATTFAPAQKILGSSLAELVAASHLAAYARLLDELGRGAETSPQGLELCLKKSALPKGGDVRIVEVNAIPVRAEGDLRAIHWLIRDVTHIREVEYDSKIFSLVLGSSVEGVLITDCAGDILAVNAAFTRITGYSADEVIGRNPRLLSSGLHDRSFYEKMWDSMRAEGMWQGQIIDRRKNGELYTAWVTMTAVPDSEGKFLSYIAVFADLTRLLEAENLLSHMTHHDALTRLPNRQLLQERLQQMIKLARHRGEAFALLLVDLDRLRQAYASFGHAAGDLLMQEVAGRLSASIGEVDTLARFPGDRFVILAPGSSSDADISLVAEKLLAAIARPLLIEGHSPGIGANIGCVRYPEHGEDVEALLEHADVALCQAKQRGANTRAIYRTDGQSPA